MKIVLSAFGNKLRGVMEIPEDTGPRFRLAMTQPITMTHFGGKEHALNSMPVNTICIFEWTGGTFSQEGHPYDKARDYQLIDIQK